MTARQWQRTSHGPLRLVTTGAPDPLEGAWASRSAASARSGPAARRRGRSSECTAVAEYTGLWGWDVVPGARAAAAAGASARAARADCPAPGRPSAGLRPRGARPAPRSTRSTRGVGASVPGAAVLLPVGRAFDVIEVAEPAGRRALVRLERMGLPLGPVAADPGRPRPVLRRPGRRRRTARAALPDGLGRRRPRPARPRPGRPHHRAALRPRRPRPGALAAPADAGHGGAAAAGPAAAGHAGLRLPPLARRA